MDLIIRNALIRGQKEPQDIAIENGKFVEIGSALKHKGKKEIDAKGHLLCPPFVDPHLHLDAVLSVGDPRFNMSGTLLEGIQIWGERKPHLNKGNTKTKCN